MSESEAEQKVKELLEHGARPRLVKTEAGYAVYAAWWSSPVPIAIPKGTSFEELWRYHRDYRSEHAQEVDEALEAKIAPSPEAWRKHPDKYDIPGIDYFPLPTKRGSFELNAKIFAHGLSDYYGRDLMNVHVIPTKTQKEFEKYYGRRATGVYAFHRGGPYGIVVFSPKAVETVKKGRIENERDFYAFSAIAHEYGHAAWNRGPFGSAFDEGSNEILAVRFTLDNVQMDRKFRNKLRAWGPEYAYWNEVNLVADTAFLLNKGNPKKAINWIKRVRSTTSEREKRRLHKQIFRQLVKSGLDAESAADILFAQAHTYGGDRKKLYQLDLKVRELIKQKYPKAYDAYLFDQSWWARA